MFVFKKILKKGNLRLTLKTLNKNIVILTLAMDIFAMNLPL